MESYLFLVIIIISYTLDLIVGDPYWFPHPVIYMGKMISTLEKFSRKHFIRLKIAGMWIWIVTSSISYTIAYIVCIIFNFNIILDSIITIVLLCTCFSTRCLANEAIKVYIALEEGSIDEARKKLSYIVGRDTVNLSESEIIRATVETVAENTVDGTISPMFYAFCGGVPLAVMYKAVNTMDSMLGYKNERYKDIGMFSAKMDDLFNYIPARISLISFSIASFFLGYDYKNCFKVGIRDRKNHKSLNCVYPEGAVSGALGIQLGGTNTYFGKNIFKPTIGDKRREIERDDIKKSIKLLYFSTFITLILFIFIWGIYVYSRSR